MSGVDVVHGIVSNPSVRNIGEQRPIPIDPATDSVRVVIASGGGILPFGNWKGSGTLVGAAIASFGYAADEPAAIATDPVRYVRNVSTANTKLGVYVTVNTFVATATTFVVYKNGVATLQTIVVAAAATGLQQSTGAFPFLDTDTFDLRAQNPGGVAEVGKTISFGYGVDFF